MAIVIPGRTACRSCGQVIQEGDDAVGFAVFVSNEFDPLYLFNDAPFHRSCFEHEALGREALERQADVLAHSGPGHRSCAQCGEQIEEYSEYIGFGYLTGDSESPLHAYNFTQLHRAHVAAWPKSIGVLSLLDDLAHSGRWGGNALNQLIGELRREIEGRDDASTSRP